MTAPPDEPNRFPSDASDGQDGERALEPPELTTPLHELDSIAAPELTARLGEPGGELGIGAPTDGAAPAVDEGSIPMLTEVLGDGKPARDAAVIPETPTNEEDWNRIALQVQASVLERLQRRSDRLIDRPMQERLHSIIDVTTERLLADLRESIRETVQEAVARAISEELARAHHELRVGSNSDTEH